MLIVDLKTTNPYVNLATEEYLLYHRKEDFFVLWQNEPCIVVGRNQNTLAEINHEYVTEHHIPVVRRLTGGGAVFHDLGNLNYTFIEADAKDKFGNYGVFSTPVLQVLHKMGVPATLSGRNDLLVDGKKICGNAQTMFHGRMMHHGCILFSANVNHLVDALKVNPLKIQSKGIQSVRSRVTNIADHLTQPMTVTDFRRLLLEEVLGGQDNELYELTPHDQEQIEILYREKYSTYEWNFGFKKDYSFCKDTLFSAGLVTLSMDIKEDKIAALSVKGDFFGIADVAEFEQAMLGTPYEPSAILERLNTLDFSSYFAGISSEEFIKAFF
jgi:lipoate-protein ligase A